MIGLFDSGIGGLTVLKSLQEKMPNESFVYLGDTARLPYGTKSPETILRYTKQNVQFLKQQGVHTVVSACHSASSSILFYDLKDEDVDLYNVIEPSCSEAQSLTKTQRIGLMATQATVEGGQYHKRISTPLFAQACPLLVPLVEAGWINDPISEMVVEKYVTPLLADSVDVIILGCTHFPLLKPLIQKKVGSQVRLVDPGETLATLLAKKSIATKQSPQLKIFLTDESQHFVRLAQQILNDQNLHIQKIDL